VNATANISFGEGNSTVCAQDNCYHESYTISPIALLSSPDENELCPSSELGNCGQIQCNSHTEPSQQGGLGMVATTVPLGAPVYSLDPSITIYSDASNQGWGAVLNG